MSSEDLSSYQHKRTSEKIYDVQQGGAFENTLPYLFFILFAQSERSIYMSNRIPTNSMRFRVRITMTIAFFLLFLAVAINFFRISVLNNKKYQAMANSQHFGSITISAHRGTIYDAKGVTLAKSASVYKVFIDPKRFREDMAELEKAVTKRNAEKAKGEYKPEYDEQGNELDPLPDSVEQFRQDAVALLAEKLDIKPEKITEAMEADKQYVELQKQVEGPVADEVLAFFNQYGLISLNVLEDTKRYYPQEDLAASIIGFTTADGNGIYGIEALYDDYLSGVDGRTVSAKDSNGNELPYRYSKTYDAKNGDNLYLTIDSNIQLYLQKHLEEMVHEHDVKNRACAILMNCKTGAIYGMATYPSFDLNKPYEIGDKVVADEIKNIKNEDEAEKRLTKEQLLQWKNKCITETYEPGSVFKVITSASAIEENLIDFEKAYLNCTGAVTFENADPIHCHQTSGHGMQTFQQALTNSCNPAFMTIGASLGYDKFYYYLEAFGFKEPTGIDLPAEVNGYLKTKEDMNEVDLAVYSFGQGLTITPLEMITSYCAAINGGYLLQPYVVDKIVDDEGNVVMKHERTVRRQVVSEDTSEKLRKCLENVVLDNKDNNVYIKGYSIGGKSGTSQRISETGNSKYNTGEGEDEDEMEYGASYCCFTPVDDPEIILLVLADMPSKANQQYYGSKVAVPAARDIFNDVLPYLGISPEYTDEELKDLPVRVPLLEGSLDDAKETLASLGLTYEKVGNGIEVVSQCPQTGSSVAKGGCVYLYTEKGAPVQYTEVPDFSYMDYDSVVYTTEYYGINYVPTGLSPTRDGAFVNAGGQSIPAGSQVPKGTVIELEFTASASSFTEFTD